jgi:predicted ATPase
MITKWIVSNFKSIIKETQLTFAPLTLFAGPNSSGKSAILQSLLLVSQTLAHKVQNRSVVLNGSLAKLGQFDDLRSYDGEFDQITIGWECHPPNIAQMDINENTRFLDSEIFSGFSHDSIKEISCKLSFDSNPGSPERNLYQLQPHLFLFSLSSLISSRDNPDKRSEITISRAKNDGSKFANLNGDISNNELSYAGLEYDIDLDQDSQTELRNRYTSAEPVGCTLQHFLPSQLLLRVNLIKEVAKIIHEALTKDQQRFHLHPRFYRRFIAHKLMIPDALINQVQTKLGKQFTELFHKHSTHNTIELGLPIREWFDRISNLRKDKRKTLFRILSEWKDLHEIILNVLRSEKQPTESEYKLLLHRKSFGLQIAVEYLQWFFSNSVKYLGPLRDEPKSLYPLATYADPKDGGIQGEMTAAVLNLHCERLIQYIPSASFGKMPFDPNPVARSLEAAVTDWLKYLGVAETATSIDKGKLGHELKICLSEGGPNHDLTHVGVGVSQVLPILVMCLLADRDTTLIIEQPELHLHPKVQVLLADFFLSIVLSGKQCLIETHSEHLINRLRYRAAADENNNILDENLKIYFVEKTDGSSVFREVKVNEFGAILDWPEGFFDQSQSESESILLAAVAKRKQQRGK